MDNFYENRYVQVGLPLLMGVAAASSPAGARGAGALLNTLGAMQGVSEGRERSAQQKARTRIQELQLEQERLKGEEGDIQYQNGQFWRVNRRTGTVAPITAPGPGQRLKEHSLRLLEGAIGGGEPPPPVSPPIQPGPVAPQTGVPGQISMDLQRTLGNTTREAPAQSPGAQLGPLGGGSVPATGGGTSLARLQALAQTPEGIAALYLSGDPALIRYAENANKDAREIALAVAKQRALQPGELSQAVARERALQPIMLERQRAQGETGLLGAARRQTELRTEEQTARQGMSVREAEQANLLKEGTSSRYWSRLTGEQDPDYAWLPVQEINRREKARELILLSPENDKRMRGYQEAIPLLEGIRNDIATIFETGIFKGLKPGDRIPKAIQGTIERWLQTDTPLATAVKNIQSAKVQIARIQGETGALATRDVQTALEALPTLSWVPDTIDVAYGAMNNLMRLTNRHMGLVLGNKDFQHPLLQPLVVGEGGALVPTPSPLDPQVQDILKQYTVPAR